jgi:hypothetical protein
LHRGYTAEEVVARGYRTLPASGRWKLAQAAHGGNPDDLLGVPGFRLHGGEPGLSGQATSGTSRFWSIAGAPGLLIPCRAPDGTIRAWRVRPDSAKGKGKYRWLSSAGRPGGAGSGVHCHVARPLSGVLQDEAVWVTEGEIKSDLAAERLGAVVVSIPGVGSWARALADLVALRPDGGRVVVAVDSDWQSNKAVHAALWGLAQACAALGYCVGVATWPTSVKGLDDLLTAGGRPEISPAANAPEPTWGLKLSSRILSEAPRRRRSSPVTLAEMRGRIGGVIAAALCGDCLCG